jgi:hypothetical protein
MRILFLCHRLPYPPKRGGKIRPFNMIRHLSRRHEVTVATIARSGQELADGEPLRRECHAVHVAQMPAVAGWARFAANLPGTFPATFAYFRSPWLARTVRDLLAHESFEAIVVHSSSMGPYVAHHDGCRKIMDFGDADSEKWFEYARSTAAPLSLGFWWEGTKVRRYERWLGERFDVATVNTAGEREVLQRFVSRPIEVITNGVDLEYFRPQPGGEYHARRLVFTGNMSYRPNVDAVKRLVADILPRVWRERPDVELYIVGMDPTPAVRRLGDGKRIVVTGRVQDVRPFLGSAAVAVAPLRVARGLQNKVLEAMAMGVPVVASPSAAAGVDAVIGRDLRVAADPDGFAHATLELLNDPAARARVGIAGRESVERGHDWDQLLARLEALIAGHARAASPATGSDGAARIARAANASSRSVTE